MINNSKIIELDNEWGHLFWIGKDSNESIKKDNRIYRISTPVHNVEYIIQVKNEQTNN